MVERPLTPKQQRFVAEYLLDLNGTQAAIRSGYSPNGARVTGTRLLAHPNIAACVAAGKAKHAEKCGITLDRLTDMTLAAYNTAMAGGEKGPDAGSAVKAVGQLSRMHGFDVGKRPNERSPIEDLTAEERDAVRRMVEDALERARAQEQVS